MQTCNISLKKQLLKSAQRNDFRFNSCNKCSTVYEMVIYLSFYHMEAVTTWKSYKSKKKNLLCYGQFSFVTKYYGIKLFFWAEATWLNKTHTALMAMICSQCVSYNNWSVVWATAFGKGAKHSRKVHWAFKCWEAPWNVICTDKPRWRMELWPNLFSLLYWTEWERVGISFRNVSSVESPSHFPFLMGNFPEHHCVPRRKSPLTWHPPWEIFPQFLYLVDEIFPHILSPLWKISLCVRSPLGNLRSGPIPRGKFLLSFIPSGKCPIMLFPW